LFLVVIAGGAFEGFIDRKGSSSFCMTPPRGKTPLFCIILMEALASCQSFGRLEFTFCLIPTLSLILTPPSPYPGSVAFFCPFYWFVHDFFFPPPPLRRRSPRELPRTFPGSPGGLSRRASTFKKAFRCHTFVFLSTRSIRFLIPPSPNKSGYHLLYPGTRIGFLLRARLMECSPNPL